MTDASMSRSLSSLGLPAFCQETIQETSLSPGLGVYTFPARCRNGTQEIDMIGLRYAAPDRQGNPVPRTTKVQERPPLRSENTKIVASGRGAAQSVLIEFLECG